MKSSEFETIENPEWQSAYIELGVVSGTGAVIPSLAPYRWVSQADADWDFANRIAKGMAPIKHVQRFITRPITE